MTALCQISSRKCKAANASRFLFEMRQPAAVHSILGALARWPAQYLIRDFPSSAYNCAISKPLTGHFLLHRDFSFTVVTWAHRTHT
jgi:hypothetical protein